MTSPQQGDASQTDPHRTPIDIRYPQFAEFDAMDDNQRIETLSRTLDALQRELDDQRQS